MAYAGQLLNHRHNNIWACHITQIISYDIAIPGSVSEVAC